MLDTLLDHIPLDDLDQILATASSAELEELEHLVAAVEEAQRYEWPTQARPEQLPPPGGWLTWLLMGGRGSGKTRSGAEFVRDEIEAGRARRVAVVSPTAADARDVIVEGDSGLLAISPPWLRAVFEPSKRRVRFIRPDGSFAWVFLYSAEEPERLRGPQHDLAWCDEFAIWPKPQATLDLLLLGLRLGQHPRLCVTTTPRPIQAIKDLLASSTSVVSKLTTHSNLTNLAPSFRETILSRFEGTSYALQELEGELVEEVEGALWSADLIAETRVATAPEMTRVIVIVDPSGGDSVENDHQGVVVVGLGVDGDAYVLADYTCRLQPDGWGRRAVRAFLDYEADVILTETNYGGNMATNVVRVAIQAMEREGEVTIPVPVRPLSATKSKRVRAEPVHALFQQGRAHLVGRLPEIERELTTWVPDSGQRSPNRLDCVVHGVAALLLGNERRLRFRAS